MLSFKIGTLALCGAMLVSSGCTSSYSNTVSRGAEDFSATLPADCTSRVQEHCNTKTLSLRDAQRQVVYTTRADVVVTPDAPSEDQHDIQEMATSDDSATIRKTIDDDTLESAPELGQ